MTSRSILFICLFLTRILCYFIFSIDRVSRNLSYRVQFAVFVSRTCWKISTIDLNSFFYRKRWCLTIDVFVKYLTSHPDAYFDGIYFFQSEILPVLLYSKRSNRILITKNSIIISCQTDRVIGSNGSRKHDSKILR